MTAERDNMERGLMAGCCSVRPATPPPEHGTNADVCTVQVENFDAMVKKIEKAGGMWRCPRWRGRGICRCGGDTFGVHQAEDEAGKGLHWACCDC